MSSKLLLSLVIVAAISAVPQTLSESRYRLLFDNDYVSAFALELPPRSKAQVYQNTHDVLWVSVADAEIQAVGDEGSSIRLDLRPGDARFFRSFHLNSLVNNAGAATRGVLVELKKRSLTSGACGCGEKVENSVCGCRGQGHLPAYWALGVGTVVIGGTTLEAGQSYLRAARRDDTLLVAVTGLQLRDEALEGSSEIKIGEGDVFWVAEGVHKFRNTGEKAARFVSIEF